MQITLASFAHDWLRKAIFLMVTAIRDTPMDKYHIIYVIVQSDCHDWRRSPHVLRQKENTLAIVEVPLGLRYEIHFQPIEKSHLIQCSPVRMHVQYVSAALTGHQTVRPKTTNAILVFRGNHHEYDTVVE